MPCYSLDMKFQATPYSCGPAAVVNAMRCLGVKVKEKEVRQLAGTTKQKGTDTNGILLAVNNWAQGQAFDAVGFTSALAKIQGGVAIICVHGWDHWCTIIGRTNQGSYIVFDPWTGRRNRAENGIKILNSDQLRKMWVHGRTYSGVIVTTA